MIGQATWRKQSSGTLPPDSGRARQFGGVWALPQTTEENRGENSTDRPKQTNCVNHSVTGARLLSGTFVNADLSGALLVDDARRLIAEALQTLPERVKLIAGSQLLQDNAAKLSEAGLCELSVVVASKTPTPETERRLRLEIQQFERDTPAGFEITVDQEDPLTWRASIPGPSGSPYDGSVLQCNIFLPSDYPFSSPAVCFTSDICHCNVSPHGFVCQSAFKSEWSPAFKVVHLLMCISALLADPDTDHMVNPAAADTVRWTPTTSIHHRHGGVFITGTVE